MPYYLLTYKKKPRSFQEKNRVWYYCQLSFLKRYFLFPLLIDFKWCQTEFSGKPIKLRYLYILNRPRQAKTNPSNMRKMCGFKSSCTCANSPPGTCSPLKHHKVSNDSVGRQRKPRLVCAWRGPYDVAKRKF